MAASAPAPDIHIADGKKEAGEHETSAPSLQRRLLRIPDTYLHGFLLAGPHVRAGESRGWKRRSLNWVPQMKSNFRGCLGVSVVERLHDPGVLGSSLTSHILLLPLSLPLCASHE